jgi:hypothetical protein
MFIKAATIRLDYNYEGMMSLGLKISKSHSMLVNAFSDANWAGCPDGKINRWICSIPRIESYFMEISKTSYYVPV